MNISAIISEYNPLHKGHVYHINKTKELTNCDAIICIMSGNFVQRGLPAIMDKWSRAEMALLNGVDLVIELPTIYALSSAEFFAKGAVELINSLNVVQNLSFGSEYGDIDILMLIANILCEEPEDYKNLLKNYLSQGLPYTFSRSNALINYLKTLNLNYDLENIKDILNSPNNILGIEYCKSLIKNKSHINPITVKRKGSGYNEESLNNELSSATSIRKYLRLNKDYSILKQHLPEESYNLLNEFLNKCLILPSEDDMVNFLKFKVFTQHNKLKLLPDASEGLHNKILNEIGLNNSFNDLVMSIKSKRYTFTRISRILCQYFIGFEEFDTKTMRSSSPEYARILGFNAKGKDILNKVKKNSSLKLYTNIPKYHEEMLELDLQSTRAYSLLNKSVDYNKDYFQKPIII